MPWRITSTPSTVSETRSIAALLTASTQFAAAKSRNCASSPTAKENSSWCRATCGILQFLVDDRPQRRQFQRAVVFPAIDEYRGRALHAGAVAVFRVARDGLPGFRGIAGS